MRGLVQAGVVKADQILGADVAEAAVDQFTREIPGAGALKTIPRSPRRPT